MDGGPGRVLGQHGVVDGELLRIAVSIDRPLHSPDVHLLAWDGERMSAVAPPAVGDCVLVRLAPEGRVFPIPLRPAPTNEACAPTRTAGQE